MQFKDYYKTLGVEPDADTDEIRRAYRRLARKYHPDLNKEAGSEDNFKEVGEAWEALKDPEKRKQYDQLRSGGWRQGDDFEPPPGWTGGFGHTDSGQGFGDISGFSDFFENLFGGGMGGRRSRSAPGRDIHAHVEVDLESAYAGGSRRITLNRTEAGPDGRLVRRQQNLDVDIPAGVTPGQQIRLSGQGESGFNGGPKGDLYLEVDIRPHRLFELEGRNVHLTLPIAPWEAALGAKVNVPTLGGQVTMNIPAGASSGKRLRLKGRGLPGKSPGDQVVTLKVVVPKATSERHRELYEQLEREQAFDPRADMGVVA